MARLLFIVLIISSCSTSRMMETNLYFGQSIPGGGMVTDKQWSDFTQTYISKVFPEGSTIIKVTGNWLDTTTHQLITEPTYQVVHIYKKNKQRSSEIDSLRQWYIKLFHQESVLRVDRKVSASF